MRRLRALLLGPCCLLVSAACANLGSGSAPNGPSHAKQVVLAFYEQALVQKQVRAAFEHFASSAFVEHKPDVPGGTREATIRYLEDLVASLPTARWEVLRTVAEGDVVAPHARFLPAPEAAAYAIADFFRVQDGAIVEHWDVVAGPPEDAVNPNPRF
ncbi:MAG: nuclear transport factor 2 family protein [Planctomycetota bacterium]